MKCIAVVAVFVLFHRRSSAQIQEQSNSSLPGNEPIRNMSAASFEFMMNRYSRESQLSQDSNMLQEIASNSKEDSESLICPQGFSTGINEPVQKYSTCPWYYSVSHDPKRFPAAIVNAEPLCNYAIGSQNMYECAPVIWTIQGLRQQNELDDEGNFIWVEETINTVVGFTAAARRIADNAQTTASTPNDQSTLEWAKR